MSANRQAKGSSSNTFESYRQIAPESVDDQKLRDIIKNNNNDHAAILLAIENIWHDIPDQRAVGSDWVTTSKSKKDAAPVKGAVPRRADSGGRGSAGRGGRGAAGGRGGGDGRGDRSGRGGASKGSRTSPARATPSPTVAPAATAGEDTTEEEVESEEPSALAAAPVAAPAAATPAPVKASIAAPTGPVWGQGLSFAEKLKRAEAEKAKLAALPKEPAQTEVAAPAAAAADNSANDGSDGQKGRPRSNRRSRGGKKGEESAVSEVTEGTEALTVNDTPEAKAEDSVPPPPPLVHVGAASAPAQATEPAPVQAQPAAEAAPAAPSTATSAPVATEGFLKMGKWDTPVEAAEMASFQFGSFGNAYEDSANNGVSASQVGTNPAAAPWTGSLHTEDKPSTSSNVWGAPAETNLDMSGGLFSQQSAPAGADLTSSSAAASRAPPGLAPKPSNNTAAATNKAAPSSNKPKTETAQSTPAATTSVPAQNAAYNQAGYSQPPGMTRNTGAALNAVPAGPAGLYPYPGFELAAQAQFAGYPLGGAVPPVASAAAPATSTAPTGATTTHTSTSAGAASATQQNAAANAQQQAYGPGPFPFYNPYYANNFYYGQPQMANFYGQGRDIYQQRGPYGANPYGGAGSLYPGDVYGQQVPGQFPDASGNYMGLHPGMQGAGGNANANNAGQGGNKAGKGSAGAGNNPAAGAGAQGMAADPHAANLLMNSAYGYVNPYGRADWQGYPGAQAGGWGGMMPFPTGASPTPLAGAQGQQGNQQQGNQQQGGRAAGGNANNYGGRSGAGGLPSGSQGPW